MQMFLCALLFTNLHMYMYVYVWKSIAWNTLNDKPRANVKIIVTFLLVLFNTNLPAQPRRSWHRRLIWLEGQRAREPTFIPVGMCSYISTFFMLSFIQTPSAHNLCAFAGVCAVFVYQKVIACFSFLLSVWFFISQMHT